MMPTAAVAEALAAPTEKIGDGRLELLEFVRQSRLRSLVIGTSKNPNAKVTILLVSPESGRSMLAVKVPTTDAAARAVEAEARLLVDLAQFSTGSPGTIPEIVDIIEYEGKPGIVMTAVNGTSMATSYLRRRHTSTPATVADDFTAIDAWLTDFQRRTAGPDAALEMDGGVVSRLESRFGGGAQVRDDLARLAEIHHRLRANVVPRTAVHGDLWLANILVADRRISGVVDWEAGAASGEPVRDLARFALMYALFLDRRTRGSRRVRGHAGLRAGAWGAGITYAIGGAGWFPDLFRRFIRDGLDRLGAAPSAWRDVALAGIAEVAAFADHDEFAREHLDLFHRLVSGARSNG